MNRRNLEQRLRDDAGKLQAACPPHARQRVAAHIRADERTAASRRVAFPALAGACAALAVFVSVWMVRDDIGVDRAGPTKAGLNAAPVVASSDRLLASREAALEDEWRLIERDLRSLRDHVTKTFDRNPNG
jgi:hypothetical protein